MKIKQDNAILESSQLLELKTSIARLSESLINGTCIVITQDDIQAARTIDNIIEDSIIQGDEYLCRIARKQLKKLVEKWIKANFTKSKLRKNSINVFDRYNGVCDLLYSTIRKLKPWKHLNMFLLPYYLMYSLAAVPMAHLIICKSIFKNCFETETLTVKGVFVIKNILQYCDVTDSDRNTIIELGILRLEDILESEGEDQDYFTEYESTMQLGRLMSENVYKYYFKKGNALMVENFQKILDKSKFEHIKLQVLATLYNDSSKKDFILDTLAKYICSDPLAENISVVLKRYITMSANYYRIDSHNLMSALKDKIKKEILKTYKNRDYEFYDAVQKFCEKMIKMKNESNINLAPSSRAQHNFFASENDMLYWKNLFHRIAELLSDPKIFTERILMPKLVRQIAFDTLVDRMPFSKKYPAENLFLEVICEIEPHCRHFTNLISRAVDNANIFNHCTETMLFLPLVFPESSRESLSISNMRNDVPCWPSMELANFWQEKVVQKQNEGKTLKPCFSMHTFLIETPISMHDGRKLNLVCNMYVASIICLFNDTSELSVNEIVDTLKTWNYDLDINRLTLTLKRMVQQQILIVLPNKKFSINYKPLLSKRQQKLGYIKIN